MEFTYEGFVRYSYGFQNPNHAAAFICALLPVFWGMRCIIRKKIPHLIIFIPEITLYVALVFTYSRAGIITLILSGFFYFILYKKFVRGEFKINFSSKNTLWFGLILLALSFFSIYTGALKRYFGWIASPDKSLVNRFPLWEGAMWIIADNPSGTGTGLSGRIYTEFYQSHEAPYVYRTMVNSFLTFIAEQGIYLGFLIAVLCVTIAILNISLITGKNERREAKIIIISLLTVLFSALISGMSSTCFDVSILKDFIGNPFTCGLNPVMQTTLFIYVFIVTALLGFAGFKLSSFRTVKYSFLIALSISFISLAAILSLGISSGLDTDEKCHVISTPDNARWMTISPRDENEKKLLFFPDDEITNFKKLRQFFRNKYPSYELIFPLTATDKMVPVETLCTIVLCGKNTHPPALLSSETIFYLPSLPPPPAEKQHIIKIYLNEFDEHGFNSSWENQFPENLIDYIQ